MASWVGEEVRREEHGLTDRHGRGKEQGREREQGAYSRCLCQSVKVSDSLCSSCLVANAVLSLLNLACWFIDRQVDRLASDFENNAGFTERIYRIRSANRKHHSKTAIPERIREMKRQPIDPEDILLRLDWTEDDDLEFKSGKGGVPHSLWDTYSLISRPVITRPCPEGAYRVL
ncbi:MAG: hypothetical protein HGA97_08480 [Chlorobiaceae bacterium]|nr:hypothetical protein [Chlorobiaceae bacterium]